MANSSSSTHLQIFALEAEIKLDINEADGCFMSCLLRGKRRRCIKKKMPCFPINHYYSFRATFFHGIEKGEMCLDEGEICWLWWEPDLTRLLGQPRMGEGQQAQDIYLSLVIFSRFYIWLLDYMRLFGGIYARSVMWWWLWWWCLWARLCYSGYSSRIRQL